MSQRHKENVMSDPAPEVTASLDERQRQLLRSAQAAIEADPHFAALTAAGQPAPTLSRAEVETGLSETQRGYLYLRYDVQGAAPQEFWAHVGAAPKLSWKSGQVSVVLPPAEPAPTAAAITTPAAPAKGQS